MTLHIATSYWVGRAVRRGIRQPVRSLNDGWLVGPYAWDLEAQMRMRTDFWAFWPSRKGARAAFTASYRRVLKGLDADEPVLLWTSPTWNDRVALWALCSYRLQRRPTQPDLSLVVMGEYGERHARLSFGIVYVTLEPAMARPAWETARPLSLSEVREKARFWKKLTAPAPILSGRPLRETPSRKELFELGAYQAGLFPKQTARGLSLSTLDALMLDLVDDKPRSPAEIFMRRGKRGDAFRQWFDLTGDIILFERLAQWAKHGPSPALHAEPWQAPNGWQTARYTLTDTGRAILRKGLTSINQAPPLPIWGVTAYDPKNPWVVVDDGEGRPRLQRLGES